jgi:hypothetical protein
MLKCQRQRSAPHSYTRTDKAFYGSGHEDCEINNQIDNRLSHDKIACSGPAFPFDNFHFNHLVDFFKRCLPAYLKHPNHVANTSPTGFIEWHPGAGIL